MARFVVVLGLLLACSHSLYAESNTKYRLIGPSHVRELIPQMNDHANRGFRLISLGKYPIWSRQQNFETTTVIGILEYDPEDTYEYDWFEAATPGDLQSRMNHRAERGFYFKEMFPFADQLCGGPPPTTGRSEIELILDTARASLEFTYGGIFIVERAKSVSKKFEYRVAAGVFGSDEKVTNELEAQMQDHVRGGYKPVAMAPLKLLNRHAVSLLLERDSKDSVGAADYRVIVSEFGFEKKINQSARSGYRLMFNGLITAKRFALMVEGGDGPATYEWIDTASKKEYKSKKDSLFRDRDFTFAVYDFSVCDYAKQQLVFVQPTTGRSQVQDTRLVKLTTSANALLPGAGSASNAWKDAENRINDLVKQGYVIRDAIYSDGIDLILQKPLR